MSSYESDHERASSPHQGDVVEAVTLIREALVNSDEAIESLRKRLDPIMLESPEVPMKSIAKEPQSRSPLADELYNLNARIRSQRQQLIKIEAMIQI